MRPTNLCFLVLCFVVPHLSAQSPSVVLPWGLGDSELGVYRDGDYLKGPAFFDVAPDGAVWVADAYKERVARYSLQGKYLGEVLLPEVSPRMTAFRVVEDGSVVVSNDQTLSRWTARGDALGRRGLGLILPEGYWFTSNRSSIVLQDESGWFSQEWDREFASMTRFALASAGGSRAALKDGSAIRMAFWKDQATVFGWKAAVDADAMLVRTKGEGTVWSLVRDGQRFFWSVDAKGALVGRIAVPATPGAPGLFALLPDGDLLWGQWSEQGLVLNTSTWRL